MLLSTGSIWVNQFPVLGEVFVPMRTEEVTYVFDHLSVPLQTKIYIG